METSFPAQEVSSPARQDRSGAARSGSCITCAKAKSKCVRRPGKDICVRCARLQKTCQIREPVARKRKSVKVTHMAQLKQLETKLENIAHALSTTHPQGSLIAPRINASSSHPVVDPTVKDTAQSLSQQDARHSSAPSGSMTYAEGSSHGKASVEVAMASMSVHDIDVLFDRYQRLMAPNMPFVVLPPGMSATSLRKSEPFLMQAITVVASFHDTARQQSIAKELMHHLCERLLLNGEKTLGLLQGLLIFSNWYNPDLYIPQNSTNILHLAIALTTDLNIDRGPGTCEKAQMDAAMKAFRVAQPTKALSNDERRAVLGTFYLTSVIFTSFRKVDTLQWTHWLTECANVLRDAQEYESDYHLVQLVHMQRIMQEAMIVEYKNAPIQFYANSFLGDLKTLGVPYGNGSMAKVLQLQDACTRIAIWQRAFVGLAGEVIESSVLRQRLDGMWSCMEAVKAYIEIYMAIPVEHYLTIPFGAFAQFAYTFAVIVRALSIEVDGWDAQALRSFVDFSAIMDRASRRYDLVSQVQVDDLTLENDAFSKWATRIRWAKTFHDARLMSATSKTQMDSSTNQGTHDAGPLFGSVSTEHLPTPPGVPTDTWLNSFVNFEDFWNGVNDPSQFPVDFDPTFSNT